MKAAQFTVSIFLASVCLMGMGSAMAAPQPLSDQEMSESYAGDGTSQLLLPGMSPFASIIGSLVNPVSTERTLLRSTEFLEIMAAKGVTSLPPEVYNGRPVAQLVLPSNPVSMTMDLSQFISSMTGVKYDAPGMGKISIQNLDFGGTRIWSWNH